MTQAISYHGAHQPYLTAVADALRHDRLAVVESDAAPDDPRHGWVVIGRESSSRRFGQHLLLVLLWHEETGWARNTEHPDRHGELRNMYYAPLGLLPPPADVLTWVRAVLSGTDKDILRVRYRDFENQNDEFENALHAYWTR